VKGGLGKVDQERRTRRKASAMCHCSESGQANSRQDEVGGNISRCDRERLKHKVRLDECHREEKNAHRPGVQLFLFLLKIADTSFVDCHLKADTMFLSRTETGLHRCHSSERDECMYP
jgi:hypothetical protein